MDTEVEVLADYEAQLRMLEEAVRRDLPLLDIDRLTFHHFCAGVYSREFALPAGCVVVSKRHAKENFFLIAKGAVLIATPTGPLRLDAPYMSITKPGTKRAFLALTDTVFLTFHPNADDCTDLVQLEDRFIMPDLLEQQT
jgi:hypothetical protein